ncbi:MAG TPA: GAF domain-containing protein [Pseudonocardia sp.]|nr:GAF domain-containing protein [Pseudonocardia sp.]
MGASTPRADPVVRARQLVKIRDAVLTGSPVPEQPRPVVSDSWRRSLAAHVDPERGAPPAVFDRGQVVELRAGHPLAATLPLLRETLVAIADEAMHMMIVTDARGHILWCEGQGAVLRRAEDVGLAVGHQWSEDAIGTNAMGTALAEERSVQIHSAEHLVRTYHEWTCAASPVRDPDTGRIVGVVDVTGPVRSFHPSTTALVAAAAKLAEAELHSRMQISDERLRLRNLGQLAALRGEHGALVTPTGRVLISSPGDWLPGRLSLPAAPGVITLPDGTDGILEPLAGAFLLRLPTRSPSVYAVPLSRTSLELEPTRRPLLELRLLGRSRPAAILDGRELRLTQRHADMLAMLATHPAGVSGEQLATWVYGERGNPVTVRSEIHRLRGLLGAAVVRSNPYRLDAEVSADFRTVRADLRAGRVREAAAAYRGDLLPASEAPEVIQLREVLFGELRRATLDRRDPEAMWSLADTDSGGDDVELAEALADALPRSDPRHAAILARLDCLLG